MMSDTMNIAICGGGNLGHVCAGFLGARHKVSLFTTRPEEWAQEVKVTDLNGKVFRGVIRKKSSHPEEVIPDADLVLLCLPGYAIHDVLSQIAPSLKPSAWVGTVVSSTGFFFEAMRLLPENQTLFGFQRVPFIARTTAYGHCAELKGYKESLRVAVEQSTEKGLVRRTLEQLFCTPVELLDSYYEVSLSNSNPLLHTSRLYTLWHDWKPGQIYERNPFFYADWTNEASDLLIKMDEEFQQLLKALGLKEGAVPSVLDYYESHDAASLTQKLRSIPAFQGLLSPMNEVEGGWVPDFSSRYFTEDFPFGLRFVYEAAHEKGIDCPLTDVVFEWGKKCIEARNGTPSDG